MTSEQPQEHDLSAALARLEQCLETPIVPGEQPDWLNDVAQSCGALDGVLRQELEGPHPQRLREIERQDVALAPRVEELRDTDKKLLGLWDTVSQDVERLSRQAERTEPHEKILDAPIQRFVDQALAFVIAVRKQENALNTWHSEAFNRDRGVGD